MGLFKKKDPLDDIFEDYDRADCEDILETARALSENDRRVVAAVNSALDDPKGYIKRSAKQFAERGIKLDGETALDGLDADELLFLAMLDELEMFDYAFEFDCKCGLEDFLWGLTQIKTYELIKDVVRTTELDEEEDIEKWGRAINKALGGRYSLCYIHIDGGRYPLAIVTPEAFEKIPIPFITLM